MPAPSGNDDTAALQAVIDLASDGTAGSPNIIEFQAGVVYRVDRRLFILSRRHLMIHGNGSSVFRPVRLGDIDPGAKTTFLPQVEFSNCDDVNMDNLSVLATGTGDYDVTYDAESALVVRGCRDCVFTDNNIDHSAADAWDFRAYQAAPGSPLVACERVQIIGGIADGISRSGIGALDNILDCSVSGMTFVQVARSTVDMEMVSAASVIDGFTFENNIVMNNALGFIGGGGHGIHRNVFILNNQIASLESKYGNASAINGAKLGSTMTNVSPAAGETFTITNVASAFPTTEFVVQIDSELILCSTRVAGTVTVETRGYQGTTPAAHTPTFVDSHGITRQTDVAYITATPTRFNVVFDGNVASEAFDQSAGVLLAISRTEGATVTNNIQTITSGTPVEFTSCTSVLEANNSWNDFTVEGTMSYSDYLEDKINDAVCNNTAFVVAQVYVKLHTGDPGESGILAPAIETTRKAVSFGASVAGICTTDADVTWSAVLGSESISHVSFWDAVGPSGGNCLASGPLASSKQLIAGDTAQFLTGTLTFTSL